MALTWHDRQTGLSAKLMSSSNFGLKTKGSQKGKRATAATPLADGELSIGLDHEDFRRQKASNDACQMDDEHALQP